MTLEWDEPAAPADVATIQIYMSEDGGPFARLHTYSQDQLLAPGPGTWRANTFPVAFGVPIELAVTYDDEAGNESGWNPVDAWVPFAGASCNSGAPATPTIVSAQRGAGSLEVDLLVEASAPDIASWSAEIDQGSGFAGLTVLGTQAGPAADQVWVTVMSVDWTQSAIYRVRATDHHGQTSAAGSRDCPIPISPGDVVC